MNAQTKLSAKGQVVIPKAVRDRLQWAEGVDLEVVETAGGVLLRPKSTRPRISMDEFLASLPKHHGPPVTLEEMDQAILKEASRRFEEKTRRE